MLSRRFLLLTTVLGLFAVLLTPLAASAFAPKPPPLATPWTNQVSVTDPLPEYPRPQLTRTEWQSLNGVWQFAPASDLNNPPTGTLPEEVLVPYPIESALSGIQRHENRMYYKRTFTVPAGWSGRHVQLNFGAVMWQSKVWVNGALLGTHEGGYDAFSYDITSALRAGSNDIVVGVWAPVDTEDIPLGKQRAQPRRHLVHAVVRHLADRLARADATHLDHPARHGPERRRRRTGSHRAGIFTRPSGARPGVVRRTGRR